MTNTTLFYDAIFQEIIPLHDILEESVYELGNYLNDRGTQGFIFGGAEVKNFLKLSTWYSKAKPILLDSRIFINNTCRFLGSKYTSGRSLTPTELEELNSEFTECKDNLIELRDTYRNMSPILSMVYSNPAGAPEFE